MNLRCSKGALALFLACVCASPVWASSFDIQAPSGGAKVTVETVQPGPDSDDPLPTQRLVLKVPGHFKGTLLVDGLRTTCDTDIRWVGADRLYLRLSEAYATHLRVYNGEAIGPVSVQVQVHTDQVLRRVSSPDGAYVLVEIDQCETEDWSLYLRRAGASDYEKAMDLGWGDPTLCGGLQGQFPLEDLEWTGSRSACAVVAQHPFGARFRSKVGPVTIEWVYDPYYRRPPDKMTPLGPPRKKKAFKLF
ncbi:MAG: hypothetical protein ACREKE_09125 [bacterium]